MRAVVQRVSLASVTVDGQIVGAGMLLCCNNVAGIYELCTLPFARHQGVGTALIAALHERALRLDAPVLMSPKRYFERLPASLRTCPVVDPAPLWCWSLVTRANDERDSVAALREHAGNALRPATSRNAPSGPVWLPAADPHRDHIRSLK